MTKRKSSTSVYNELILESAGLNINLNEEFFLSDILRIDYDCEMRKELVKEYLKSVLPENILIADLDPGRSEEFVQIFTDYSALISTSSQKVAINRCQPNYISFFHDKLKSYTLVSLSTSLFLHNCSSLQSLFESCTSLLTQIKLKSDIVGFLFSISGMSARDLLSKYTEAKQLFSSESVHSSLESLRSSGPCKMRKSSFDSPNPRISLNSESFEYSLSSYVIESLNGEFVSEKTLMTEEEKENKDNGEVPEVGTPEVGFRQFEIPTAKLRFLFKLHESQLNSTSPLSVDWEKLPTYENDFFQVKSPKKCYQCEQCVMF